jgi:serine/threonine protein kinase
MVRGLQAGTSIQLGKLTVGELLGEGGFGVVHKATLEGINMTFAVKFLHPSIGNDDIVGAAKRFLREAEVLFRFRHQHIVPIYGVGEHEGRPYILMEYFPGMNLVKARQAVGSPTPDSILPFVEFVGSALSYAHQNNVVHRDIKPQNLMTTKGDARVLDFGVAGLLDPKGERFTKSSDAVAGDAFSAPELTETPMLIDPRCDIYSLGACWYWLLTGTSPKGVNWESKLRASTTIAQAYERVLLRCLAQSDKRYASAAELVDDVRALRRGAAPSQSPHDLSDDQARVLGVIVGACPTSMQNVALYGIEQEIGGRQSRLRTSLALRGLLARNLIEEEAEQSDYNREPYSVYKPLDPGATWAEQNLLRIEELMRSPDPFTATPSAATDEIPF